MSTALRYNEYYNMQETFNFLYDRSKKRPLGIPTMRDRIIQQMFKQVLEPICEARFHNHSY